MTLAEQRRLLAVGGWMSLLAATTLIDLHRDHAAAAHLRTAARFAQETGHAEIAASCLDTQAWQRCSPKGLPARRGDLPVSCPAFSGQGILRLFTRLPAFPAARP